MEPALRHSLGGARLVLLLLLGGGPAGFARTGRLCCGQQLAGLLHLLAACARPSGHLDPPYPTDPGAYGLQEVLGVWSGPGYAGKVKVFTSREDALCSSHHAGGGAVVVSVFDRVAGRWRLNEVETNRFAPGGS